MIRTEVELDDRLSEPTPGVIETLARLPGDIVFLGVAGKMGPSLARMAKRASDAAEVEKLPDAANVVYMPARKFGATGDEAVTWAVNCYLPAIVCKKYCESRIV